jgi:hypothetical protein
MRSILALSLLTLLCGSASAAPVHHAHRSHATVRSHHGVIASDPASGFAYTPPPGRVPYGDPDGPYPGASQGYAPGEREQFLDSVRRGG